MTEHLDKRTLTRLAWITELRKEGDRQCLDMYTDYGGRVCALGLLREVAFPNLDIFDLDLIDDPDEVADLAGLSPQQCTEIVNRNDGRGGHHVHTFAEIADIVEG